ncbi:hypothetical protein JZ751_009073 [Albula glossodonta]|uniref:Secreted protein n=1 Tax=Albula glossodonta TaxID=121402 RepID=A0A8T2N428_9TELE|nr:hypothetical protein JZ751_009073 [Albula glossodonta]
MTKSWMVFGAMLPFGHWRALCFPLDQRRGSCFGESSVPRRCSEPAAEEVDCLDFLETLRGRLKQGPSGHSHDYNAPAHRRRTPNGKHREFSFFASGRVRVWDPARAPGVKRFLLSLGSAWLGSAPLGFWSRSGGGKGGRGEREGPEREQGWGGVGGGVWVVGCRLVVVGGTYVVRKGSG